MREAQVLEATVGFPVALTFFITSDPLLLSTISYMPFQTNSTKAQLWLC